MPDLHKTLILAHVTKKRDENCYDTRSDVDDAYSITEIAIASEHAPFRHKKMIREAGTQVKKKRKGDMWRGNVTKTVFVATPFSDPTRQVSNREIKTINYNDLLILKQIRRVHGIVEIYR